MGHALQKAGIHDLNGHNNSRTQARGRRRSLCSLRKALCAARIVSDVENSAAKKRGSTDMEIKRVGSQPSAKGPSEWFTGTVRIDPLFQAPDPALEKEDRSVPCQ